ncbi:MAG TPA: methyltransferase domain-containing protein [Chthoniobacterales bacterium]|nr:methyltransferase domain-containing protein [Chthoniobacterales bacterium]
MKRKFDPAVPELMDRPQPVTGELERDLANIRSLNRWFGSYRQVRYFLQRWLKPREKARILDVSTGSGDIPRLIVDFARRGNVSVRIDAIDQQASTIEIARRLSNDYPEIEFSCANLFAWKPSEPYDIVLCSLTLHHFSEDDAVRVLQKCRAFTRQHVLVADLRRSLWLTVGVYLVTATVYHEAMTKTDGRLSAARAFSFAEVRKLARRAGWENFGHRKFPVGRQVIWL